MKLWIKFEHSNYLCVCPNVCASFVEPEHFGTKLVWHVCSSQHSQRFARDPDRLDCCQFQNCAATLPIALRWMRFERVWFFSLTNLHHQNSCRLNHYEEITELIIAKHLDSLRIVREINNIPSLDVVSPSTVSK